jgi:polyisoprenoid-binding protein YceI
MAAEPLVTPGTRRTWAITPGGSSVQFSIRHMLVSTVRGRFTAVRGTIVVDTAEPARSAVALTIDAASLDTGIAARDEYVRTEAFLDVVRHPTITFRSTAIAPLGGPQVRVVGDLTICGVTRPVALDARYNGVALSPFGGAIAGFEARATIAPADFGVTGNMPMPEGGMGLGDTLALDLLIEATPLDS